MNESLQLQHGRIELVLGNIVDQSVDTIVNAANTKLAGGGGVDGAIHKAAGKILKEECLLLAADEKGRRCPTGEVRVTGPGKLSAQWVIHAVGPYYNERYADKARNQLQQVYLYSLEVAAAKKCKSIAFPAISTGAYRFPFVEAATIALGVAGLWLSKPTTIEEIRFVLFKPGQFEMFRGVLATMREA